jgi:hypothetical protein
MSDLAPSVQGKLRGSVPELLTEAEAAEYIRRPKATLRQWRYLARGPAFVKQGTEKRSYVFYRRSDLDAWLDANTIRPAAS